MPTTITIGTDTIDPDATTREEYTWPAEVTSHPVERGTDPQAEQQRQRSVPSFEDFALKQYLPWAESAKRSARADESKLRNHLLKKLGRKRLADIGTRDIQMHHAAMKASHCAATANRHLALLSGLFRKAVEWNVIDRNPCAGIQQFREQAGKERFLSKDEIGRLYRAMDAEPNRVAVAALQLLLLTGVRLMEALHAKWVDVDLANEVWRLSKTKNGKVRHVVLAPEVVALLKAQPRREGCPWVFPGRDPEKPIHNVRKTFGRLLAQAGLEHARLHDLRHTYASLAVNEGASLYTVQALLGHSTPAMTQRYAHLARGTMRSASAKVSAAVRQAAAGAQF